MSIRIAAIGLGVLATFAMAKAQEGRSSTFASVDASRDVLPLVAAPALVDRPGAASSSPCPATAAMPADDARALVARIAAEEHFYPDFIQSVAKIESHFNSTALSDKGAYGLMQLEPETAERFEVDLCDPVDNVRGGVRFLRMLHRRYRNPLFVLAAYNAGEAAVEKSRGVPPFPETVRFVSQVLNDFYTWPTPGPASSEVRSAARSSGQSDLIEPRLSTTQPGNPPKKPNPRPQWDAGFVMHVD